MRARCARIRRALLSLWLNGAIRLSEQIRLRCAVIFSLFLLLSFSDETSWVLWHWRGSFECRAMAVPVCECVYMKYVHSEAHARTFIYLCVCVCICLISHIDTMPSLRLYTTIFSSILMLAPSSLCIPSDSVPVPVSVCVCVWLNRYLQAIRFACYLNPPPLSSTYSSFLRLGLLDNKQLFTLALTSLLLLFLFCLLSLLFSTHVAVGVAAAAACLLAVVVVLVIVARALFFYVEAKKTATGFEISVWSRRCAQPAEAAEPAAPKLPTRRRVVLFSFCHRLRRALGNSETNIGIASQTTLNQSLLLLLLVLFLVLLLCCCC